MTTREKRAEAMMRMPEDLVIFGIDCPADPAHPLLDDDLKRHQVLDEQLVRNIDVLGVILPVVTTAARIDGKPVIGVVDGRRRVLHAREVNRRRAARGDEPLMVRTVGRRASSERSPELRDASIAANRFRRDHSPVAIARQIASRKNNASWEQLEVVFGLSTSSLQNRLALLELAQGVQDAVDNGALGLMGALELRPLEHAQQEQLLAAALAEGGTKRGLVPRMRMLAVKLNLLPLVTEGEDAEGEDAEGEDAEGEDAEGEDAEGEDAEDEDAEGEDAEGEDAEGEDAEGEDAENAEDAEGENAEDAEGEDAEGEDAEGEDAEGLTHTEQILERVLLERSASKAASALGMPERRVHRILEDVRQQFSDPLLVGGHGRLMDLTARGQQLLEALELARVIGEPTTIALARVESWPDVRDFRDQPIRPGDWVEVTEPDGPSFRGKVFLAMEASTGWLLTIREPRGRQKTANSADVVSIRQLPPEATAEQVESYADGASYAAALKMSADRDPAETEWPEGVRDRDGLVLQRLDWVEVHHPSEAPYRGQVIAARNFNTDFFELTIRTPKRVPRSRQGAFTLTTASARFVFGIVNLPPNATPTQEMAYAKPGVSVAEAMKADTSKPSTEASPTVDRPKPSAKVIERLLDHPPSRKLLTADGVLTLRWLAGRSAPPARIQAAIDALKVQAPKAQAAAMPKSASKQASAKARKTEIEGPAENAPKRSGRKGTRAS